MTVKLSGPENYPKCSIPLGDAQHDENEVEALYASKHLRENAVSSFVRKLDNLEIVPIDSGGFTRELHKNGLNVRLIGKHLAQAHWF